MNTHRQVLYSQPGSLSTVLIIDGGPRIPLNAVSITEHDPAPGGGLFAQPRTYEIEVVTAQAQGSGSMTGAGANPWLDLAQIQGERDALVTQRDALMEQMAALRSWLSGVAPIEDPDVPGRFWCGCCHRLMQAHAADCPVAED